MDINEEWLTGRRYLSIIEEWIRVWYGVRNFTENSACYPRRD